MAVLTNLDTGAVERDDGAVAAFLGRHGVHFERWPMPAGVDALVAPASLDEDGKAAVLQAFRPRLDALAAERGYVCADMVVLHPETPGLEEALAKFDEIHYHDDEEVRFIVDGRGVFGFEVEGGQRFSVEVHAGEYIVVPARAWHWFTLCEDRRIKAIRLFQDTSGWIPHYRDAPAPTEASEANRD